MLVLLTKKATPVIVRRFNDRFITKRGWIGAFVVAMVSMTPGGYSQDRSGDSLAEMWRTQLTSLAESVLDSARFENGAHVGLAVEAAERKTIVENAFLASLQARGLEGFLAGGGRVEDGILLRIADVHIEIPPEGGKMIGDEAYKIEFDARIESPARTRYLGHFLRERGTKETPAEQESVLGRILEPLVVISGTVLIVYLFFTVRS